MSGETKVMTFQVVMPTLVQPTDVVTRELTVIVDGGTPTVTTGGADAVFLGPYQANVGQVVALSLVDVDDAGNRSPASTLTYQMVDDIPPAQPGVLGIKDINETLVPSAPPAPPSAPPAPPADAGAGTGASTDSGSDSSSPPSTPSDTPAASGGGN